MEISVADAAHLLGVDASRVRSLLRRGELPGRRVGSVWLVDADGAALRAERPVAPGRPLAPWRAWALLALLEAGSGRRGREDGPLVWSSQSATRVAVSQVLRYLTSGELIEAPAARWRDLLAARTQVFAVRGHPAAIRRLLADPAALTAGAGEAARLGADLVVVDEPSEVYMSASSLEMLARTFSLDRQRLAGGMVPLAHRHDRSGAAQSGAPQDAAGSWTGTRLVVARVPAGDPWPGSQTPFMNRPGSPCSSGSDRDGLEADGAGDGGGGGRAGGLVATAGHMWASALAADLLDGADPRSRDAGRRMLSQMASMAADELARGPRGALSWVVQS